MLRRMTGIALGLALAAPAAAQSWEAPTFFAPRPHNDLGVYLTFPDGGDVGVVGIWRQSSGINLGVRGGVGGYSDDRSILIGAELFGPVQLSAIEPLALYWVSGIGASIDGTTALRIPAGVSVGMAFGSGNTVITPYVHPRVAFDLVTFETSDGDDETDTDLNFDVDIGADLEIGDRFIVRAGYTFGSVDVLGLGAAIRLGRTAVVR